MALGKFFTRNLKYDVTNTDTGFSDSFTIITDSGGLAPQWASAGYRGAMGVPGAWRASNLQADLLGGMPWDLYEEKPDGGSRKIPSLLLEQPCPPDTRITSFSSLLLDGFFHGNAVAVYTAFDNAGYPTAMVPVPAEQVGVRRAREGEAVPRGQIIYEIGNERFSPYELLHVKGPCEPGALRGMGVLESHMATLELSAELAKQAKSSSGAGIPTGVLRSTNPDATGDALRALKAGWMTAQASRTVAVLNSTTEFTPLAWKPTDAQLIESRQFSLHEIALIFGLDPSWLGAAQASRTYSNLGEESLNLVKYSLGGWLARFEQALSLAVPPGQQVKANLDALLRADTKTRYAAYHSGISAGWLQRSEVRHTEDLPPINGVDNQPLPGQPQNGGE